jgi:hypothetical protein
MASLVDSSTPITLEVRTAVFARSITPTGGCLPRWDRCVCCRGSCHNGPSGYRDHCGCNRHVLVLVAVSAVLARGGILLARRALRTSNRSHLSSALRSYDGGYLDRGRLACERLWNERRGTVCSPLSRSPGRQRSPILPMAPAAPVAFCSDHQGSRANTKYVCFPLNGRGDR